MSIENREPGQQDISDNPGEETDEIKNIKERRVFLKKIAFGVGAAALGGVFGSSAEAKNSENAESQEFDKESFCSDVEYCLSEPGEKHVRAYILDKNLFIAVDDFNAEKNSDSKMTARRIKLDSYNFGEIKELLEKEKALKHNVLKTISSEIRAHGADLTEKEVKEAESLHKEETESDKKYFLFKNEGENYLVLKVGNHEYREMSEKELGENKAIYEAEYDADGVKQDLWNEILVSESFVGAKTDIDYIKNNRDKSKKPGKDIIQLSSTPQKAWGYAVRMPALNDNAGASGYEYYNFECKEEWGADKNEKLEAVFRDAKDLSEALKMMGTINKRFEGDFDPILQNPGESDKNYSERLAKIIKTRTLFIHHIHQEIEYAIERKDSLEKELQQAESSGKKGRIVEVIKSALGDPRLAGLEERAKKIADLAGVMKEGLNIIANPEEHSGLSEFDRKSARAFDKYEAENMKSYPK